MTKKFTEEQYQKIVKAWQSENTYVHKTESVIDYLIDDLNVDLTLMGDVYLALANPVTREWAHDQYVEKEKLYVWHSKKINNHGKSIRLFKYTNQSIGTFLANRSDKVTEDEHLTESEIKAWGYNPEMFDKEEV